MSEDNESRRAPLARYALDRIPKLLTQQDRNPDSPTYGSFDRAYWHLRIKDFPSGMSQEFVAPLALVWSLGLPGNEFRGDPAIKNWIEAGIRFAAASAHPDGSCDDYFPFERATGASAFSLLACLQAAEIIGLEDPAIDAFFARRATWLGTYEESGRLSNHEALIVLCLLKAAARLDSSELRLAGRRRFDRLLTWQHSEGWFYEYEGCDPGYLTLTVSVLAQVGHLIDDTTVLDRARRAALVAADFMHPDGSFGGEYTSRNTYNYFPHGMEVLGTTEPGLLAANDLFLEALRDGRGPCYDDDYVIGHHVWNYLLAWRDFAPERPERGGRQAGRRYYPGAGLLIERRGPFELFVALNKGGVFKLFRGGEHVESDTQHSIRVAKGRKVKTAVAHLLGRHEAHVDTDSIRVEGTFGWAKQSLMDPYRLLVLRIVMLTVGRFFPNLIRRLLQNLLIVGAKPAPFRYRREFVLSEDSIEVVDDVWAQHGWQDVRSIGIGAAQTSIYVVMSRVYQRAQHQLRRDYMGRVSELSADRSLSHSRRFEP